MNRSIQPYEEGLSGKTGDVVYYNLDGKTRTRKHPGSYNNVPTPKQAAARSRFAAANRFAKSVIADPVLKAWYEQKAGGRCTAYAAAISEYLKQGGMDNYGL